MEVAPPTGCELIPAVLPFYHDVQQADTSVTEDRRITVFGVVLPCSLEGAQRFGGTRRLQIKGRRIIQGRNEKSKQVS
jgi:hypothetical protein